MHNYVIQCMRVRLRGIAKQVPPFFRECVLHFYMLATSFIRKNQTRFKAMQCTKNTTTFPKY